MASGDILFYHNTDLFAYLIQWRTGGPYNHVCVDVGNNHVIEANWPKVKLDTYGKPAYRYTPAIDEKKREASLEWLRSTVGDAYDWFDIVANMFGFLLPNTKIVRIPSMFICSELTAYYLREAGYIFPKTFKRDEKSMALVSPNSLARVLGILK